MEDNNKSHDVNLTILNDINKNAKMGMDSISYIQKKISDKNMKDDLTTQYAEYGKIVDKVNTQFEKYGRIPDENDITTKMMGLTGIEFNTMKDKSNSHIAEIMIQGGTMGVIECQKLLNHNPQADFDVKNILNDFMTMQENNISKMKTLL